MLSVRNQRKFVWKFFVMEKSGEYIFSLFPLSDEQRCQVLHGGEYVLVMFHLDEGNHDATFERCMQTVCWKRFMPTLNDSLRLMRCFELFIVQSKCLRKNILQLTHKNVKLPSVGRTPFPDDGRKTILTTACLCTNSDKFE